MFLMWWLSMAMVWPMAASRSALSRASWYRLFSIASAAWLPIATKSRN